MASREERAKAFDRLFDSAERDQQIIIDRWAQERPSPERERWTNYFQGMLQGTKNIRAMLRAALATPEAAPLAGARLIDAEDGLPNTLVGAAKPSRESQTSSPALIPMQPPEVMKQMEHQWEPLQPHGDWGACSCGYGKSPQPAVHSTQFEVHVQEATSVLPDSELSECIEDSTRRLLIEEVGVILAEEEISCGMKHIKTFQKLSELRAEFYKTAQPQREARGADLISADKLVDLIDHETLEAAKFCYQLPGEPLQTANLEAWYSSAVYWKHRALRAERTLATPKPPLLLPLGVSVRADESGQVWLNFRDSKNSQASVELTAFAEERKHVVGAVIAQWCKDYKAGLCEAPKPLGEELK